MDWIHSYGAVHTWRQEIIGASQENGIFDGAQKDPTKFRLCAVYIDFYTSLSAYKVRCRTDVGYLFTLESVNTKIFAKNSICQGIFYISRPRNYRTRIDRDCVPHLRRSKFSFVGTITNPVRLRQSLSSC